MANRIKVNIEDLKILIIKYDEFNKLDINDIDFYDQNGNKIELDENVLKNWKFKGLNNIDFVSTEMYLQK